MYEALVWITICPLEKLLYKLTSLIEPANLNSSAQSNKITCIACGKVYSCYIRHYFLDIIRRNRDRIHAGVVSFCIYIQ